MGIHGAKNTHQAVYVPGPVGETGTEVQVRHESVNQNMPWTAFQIQFAKECSFAEAQDFADSLVGKKSQEKKAEQLQKAAASRKRAGARPREADKRLKEELQSSSFPTSRGSFMKPDTGRAKRCGKSSWKLIAVHTHNNASYGGVAAEALEMYKFAFENQVDFICGDGNQHMQFHSRKHHKDRKAMHGENCSDIANGIFNLLARACVAQQNRNMPFSLRVNMRSIDSNIFSDNPIPQDVDCMFTQIFEWGKTESCQAKRDELEAQLVRTAQNMITTLPALIRS